MKTSQRIAKHEKEGIIFASEYKGGNISCFECEEQLSYVSQHTRNGKPVMAFFRHQANSSCSGESAEHKIAKALIVKQSKSIRFIAICPECKKRHPIIMEGEYTEELPWKKYRFDVGVRAKEDGEIIAAIEVFHTHAIEEDKIKDLDSAKIPWCEVRAKDVIEAYEISHDEISILRMNNSLCPGCCRISLVKKERLSFIPRITEMTTILPPIHQYIIRMKKESEKAISDLNIDERVLHTHLSSIANRFENLSSGKFRGISILTAYTIAPDYVMWIAREASGGFTQEQLDTAKALFKGKCLICGNPSREPPCNWCSNVNAGGRGRGRAYRGGRGNSI
jgi:hypothetical protein